MKDMFNINFNARLERQPVLEWTMKTGEKIKVADMTEKHLVNSYKLCKRQEANATWWKKALRKECRRRGIKRQKRGEGKVR